MKMVRWVLLLALFTAAGCGSVDWFPQYVRQPTTPDRFTFVDQTDVGLSTTVTSDPITVAGLTATDAPIAVSGSNNSNSEYSINGGAFTATAGTVKNGDTVSVRHTSSSSLGAVTNTVLRIGDVNDTFTSTTVTVQIPSFTNITTNLQNVATVSDPVTVNATSGTHQVRVVNGAYSVNGADFFATTQFLGVDGSQFRLRVLSPAFGHTTSAHLFIDNTKASFSVTTQ